jgi:1-acyl-sn-glycerol-3-phosphate acyltransferase
MVIWCRRLVVNDSRALEHKGPLLLACNHPNSFLDGIILDTLFRQPVYALVRGDAFKNTFYRDILRRLKLLPVYRTSEGVENLSENYRTFGLCKEIFRKNGIVQIFSEGKCVNEWKLRPLKKGTARLSLSSWESGIPLRILPVGINYSSFRRFGKNIFIQTGTIIREEDIAGNSDGARHQSFNLLLESQLKELVYEIGKEDKRKQSDLLESKPSFVKKILLFLPAVAGWIIHAPLYLPLTFFARKFTTETDHYDSVVISLLLLIYPLYLVLIITISFLITKNPFVLTAFLIIPFTAWANVQLKGQLDR